MIIPMKKAQIVVLKEDKDKLLESLQKSEVLMLVSSTEKEISVDLSFEQEILKRAEESLNIISKYREKPKLIREEFIVDYETFTKDDPRRLELLDLIEVKSQKISELKLENENLKSEISFYKPWETLNLKLSDLDSPRYARMHIGFISNQMLSAFTDYMKEIGADYEVLSTSIRICIAFACFIDDEKSNGFCKDN